MGNALKSFFFGSVFSENLPTKMTIFTCYFGVNAWNTVVVFIEKALMYDKTPGLNETTTGLNL